MILTRRRLLRVGGGVFATLPLLRLPAAAAAAAVTEIAMAGDGTGARVWFDPLGIVVRSGQTIRWTNRNEGNVHTATAYHPDNQGHMLRIPPKAVPWDSGFLMPGESFSVVLTEPGVYDYFCAPHEMAGMAGRIVVQAGDAPAAQDLPDGALPAAVLAVLPPVGTILARGVVRPPRCRETASCS